MKKQFDIEYYLEHPDTRLETRDGYEVKILDIDFHATDPAFKILAKRKTENGTEMPTLYTVDGLHHSLKLDKSENDIFFVFPDPEKKKVPLTFEDLFERIKTGKTMWLVGAYGTLYNIVDFDMEYVYYIFGGAEEIRPESYETLMGGVKFADGDPCWKEVEE